MVAAGRIIAAMRSYQTHRSTVNTPPVTTPAYSLPGFAEVARVSQSTVRLWIKTGYLRAVRQGIRGDWRIPASELARIRRTE